MSEYEEIQTYDGRIVINGRPDLYGDHDFGKTYAKPTIPYVFGNGRNNMLVHKCARIKLYWYDLIDGGNRMVRRTSPKRIAETACGMHFLLENKRSRQCAVPKPDAALCGRCHGESPTFSRRFRKWKDGELSRAKMRAKDALGCMEEGIEL